MKKNVSARLALIPAAALLALLAACGGGGDDAGTPVTAVTQSQAQAMSANSAVVPTETTDAADRPLLSTTQAVVAGGTAEPDLQLRRRRHGDVHRHRRQPVQRQRPARRRRGLRRDLHRLPRQRRRGQPGRRGDADGGERRYRSGGRDTTTSGIVVTLPLRMLTLNGSSTLSQTVVTSGATTTTTNHWTSPQIVRDQPAQCAQQHLHAQRRRHDAQHHHDQRRGQRDAAAAARTR